MYENGVDYCDYHWQRQRKKVEATHVVTGDYFCDHCFRGRELAWTTPDGEAWEKEIERMFLLEMQNGSGVIQ